MCLSSCGDPITNDASPAVACKVKIEGGRTLVDTKCRPQFFQRKNTGLTDTYVSSIRPRNAAPESPENDDGHFDVHTEEWKSIILRWKTALFSRVPRLLNKEFVAKIWIRPRRAILGTPLGETVDD